MLHQRRILLAEFVRYVGQLFLEELVFLFIQCKQGRVETVEIFVQQAAYQVKVAAQVLETEQLVQQFVKVVILKSSETFGSLFGQGGSAVHEVGHGIVADDGRSGNGRSQHQPFQSLASAQCHIHLSVGKRGGCINDGLLERQSLALVYGDGPGQSQRVLAEGAFNLFAYLLGRFVQCVAAIGPFARLYVEGGSVVASHHDVAGCDCLHVAYLSVVVASLS